MTSRVPVKLKIALLDLNHTTRGVHTNTAPLGLGVIARYLEKIVDRRVFETRLFKDVDAALEAMQSWRPNVVGIAQYSWNSELNLVVASRAKHDNPGCLVVAGGPNLDLAKRGRREFFRKHLFVDLCIAYDGEIPFAETIRRVMSGEPAGEIRKRPGPGIYAYDPARDDITESAEAPPRLKSLDELGILYADGFFDSFLDAGFHPFLQTHRGCPFTCSFCHTSDRYYSRMLFLSPDIFRRDMEYLGRRFAGRHEVVLYLANTNMSLFKEDFVIAEVIRDMQKKYDWPVNIFVNSGKDPGKLLEMSSIIRFNPGIALQTLTPSVLKNINRMNIPLEDFISFQHDMIRKTGETSETELILCLPGETKESFLATIRNVLNSGVQNVCVYTLMALKGTPLSSEENARTYGYVVRHRVVPRQFGLVRGKKVLDTEEVIVGTNTMSFEEYVELRCLCFTVSVFFSSVELVPLKRLLMESGVAMADWVFGIHRRLPEFAAIHGYYQAFIRETKEELFPTREALLEFFDRAENWDALCEGRYGDNLLRKYKQLALFHSYKQVLELALSEAQKLLSATGVQDDIERMLEDMKRYLLARDVEAIFGDGDIMGDREERLEYDIPSWLSNPDGSLSLKDFRRACSYKVIFDNNIKEKAKGFMHANKDAVLSLQILFRDGSIRDFWPKWTSLNTERY